MDSTRLLDSIEPNTHLLLGAAQARPDASVVACPGWDNRALAKHMGGVQGWIAAVVAADSTEPPAVPFPSPDDGQDEFEFGAAMLARLMEVLRSTDSDRSAWTWGSGTTVAWFVRRMAAETIVHRWDAENAAGALTPVDSDLATDALDEYIEVGLQHSANPKRIYDYPAGSLHLHRTDGDGEWLLVPSEDGSLEVTREHAKGDVAVKGSGPDLLMYMWGRSTNGLEIFGDEALAEAWATIGP